MRLASLTRHLISNGTTVTATQWICSPVSKASLPKTGIFAGAAGDFEKFSPQKFDN
jgi:hypothetical protein